ncbi:MAG: SGNH/GDSL hydrolase family protein [Candidatus Marinimicrobia bacterium]|nr:SGNH/GDSL hydrolase family protein [Candidatus Neomarinimicrobiota bacterium]
MTIPFKQGQTLLFIGDSITDAGRTDQLPPYGGGFVNFFRNMIMARHPALELRFVNAGISGNTLKGLELRWERDVLNERPDWLFIMIGINDAAKLIGSQRPAEHIYGEFRENLNTILSRSRDAGIGHVLLLSPFYIHTDTSLPICKATERYAAIMGDLSERSGFPFIDFHRRFQLALQDRDPSYWSEDHVHPRDHAHMLIAETLYREIANGK